MTKCRQVGSLCQNCSKFCLSLLASHRARGNNAFDQLRRQYVFRSGQSLPFKRDGRSGFYCIQSGYVRLNYRTKTSSRAVCISGPGQLLGYANYSSDCYTANAIQEVTACYFDLDIFTMLQAGSQELSEDLIKWLCSTINLRDERIIVLENRTAKARVSATLATLARKFGKCEPDGSVEIIPVIDRKTLSELSGTVIETFSRIVTELESESIIQRKGRAIKITNLSALHACCDL